MTNAPSPLTSSPGAGEDVVATAASLLDHRLSWPSARKQVFNAATVSRVRVTHHKATRTPSSEDGDVGVGVVAKVAARPLSGRRANRLPRVDRMLANGLADHARITRAIDQWPTRRK